MGDMADFTNELGEDEWEHYMTYRDAPLAVQYEQGSIDEQGQSFFHKLTRKPSGPGKCPVCGGGTHFNNGKFGPFYGCNSFPDCKGSRNYK